MALEIKGLQRVFKFKKDSVELVLDDPNSELSVNEVMDCKHSINSPFHSKNVILLL